ncbi:3-phenylpropionate/cinnamic acid dioxygenase ferredoxin--NAD(+) reductase subunit [Xanthobacter sp. V4C-4]|uniref:3-phenylpropionate/cinnamic acid dioxygenase ferredoxin--NAD(+) reductase subunit n=1 Tax=Xanthobacter cornucopiae TaxID=3119924 RepID=UPI00372864A4
MNAPANAGPRDAGPVHVVVGGGQAGAAAVTAMRAAGFTGRIILVGAEPHLPYERPPLSKEVLVKPESARLVLHPESFYAEKAVECRFGEAACHLDPEERRLELVSGDAVHFDKLLLATGARARAYPLLDALGPAAHTLRTIDDATALRGHIWPGRHLLVVGGGIIGLEVAASAATMGARVTVIERGGRLMARGTPAPMVDMLRALHLTHGVVFELGAELTDAAQGPTGEVTLKAADGRVFTGDVVVYGIGVELNADLAITAGLKVEDGILVDEYGRTSHPDIFAAGDVARQWNPARGAHLRFETWDNAQNQGTGVGRAMVTGEPCGFEVPWYWTDQYGHNFQVAGTHEADEWLPRGDPAALKCTLLGLRDAVVVGAITVNNGREMRPARAMIANGFKITDRDGLADPKADLRKLAEGRR